jgi:hypothetical protein
VGIGCENGGRGNELTRDCFDSYVVAWGSSALDCVS